VKVLVEMGIAGFILFLWLLARILGQGFRLFRRAQDPFFKSLGLGVVGWLVCAVVANLFGDRWTFLQVNGYMWVIAGLVCRAYELEKDGALVLEAADSTPTESMLNDPASPEDPVELAVKTAPRNRNFTVPEAELNTYRL
jgi:putative inorganic carbon (HCO3(-)) transporter